MKDPLQAQAAKLLEKLQKEGGRGLLVRPVKARPTTKVLMAAESDLQIAFIRQVVAIYARLGARGKRPPGSHEWFRKGNVPESGEEVVKLMMRRRLPFTEEMLAEMLEQIAGMDFMTFAPVVDQLVSELHKRADNGPLSSRIRRAAERIANELLVKHWPAAVAEDCGFPRAADRKLAKRLQSLV